MSSTRLDVIIFGASGYTGKYTVYEAVKLLKGLTWGIAGRSREKLEEVLAVMGKKAKVDLSKIPIIVADVDDQESLLQMAKRAKVIVNCSGPYAQLGEPVVKACLEASTHHVDVSGEPLFMETMQLRYDAEAREKGIYIVSACGFDSIPAELGIEFLKDNFNGGTVNSVETFLRSGPIDRQKKVEGAALNYGTWNSAINHIGDTQKIREVNRQLFPKRLPKFTPSLKARLMPFTSDAVGGRWCLFFPGPDKPVVTRSQRFLYENEKLRPVQFNSYLVIGSLFHTIIAVFGAMLFGIISSFSFGRKLLLAYPTVFTAGFVSREGPKEETNENTKFELTLHGQGWNEKYNASDVKVEKPINKKVTVRVKATNPGYGATCVALLLSATTILSESSRMPGTGGVLAPGAAFKDTNMLKELQMNDWTFEVVKSKL